jgi:predicted Zn-dependent peptidase
MKKRLLSVAAAAFFGMALNAQQIKFEEYDLPNGLHVILHQDNSAPVVTTGVMYHVGAKDEVKGRTGFAHFFYLKEHRTLKEVTGSSLFLQTEDKTTLIQRTTEHITTKLSLQTTNSWVFGWKLKECVTR